jgi:hypothetical protein
MICPMNLQTLIRVLFDPLTPTAVPVQAAIGIRPYASEPAERPLLGAPLWPSTLLRARHDAFNDVSVLRVDDQPPSSVALDDIDQDPNALG